MEQDKNLYVRIQAILAVLSVPRYLGLLMVYFLLTLFLLVWLFNIQQLVTIIQTAPSELPRVLIEGYLNLFRYGFHVTPILLILIALLQSLLFVLVQCMRAQQASTKGSMVKRSLVVSLFAAGCVACGGSVISPVLTLTGVASIVSIGSALNVLFLVLALAVCLYSVYTASSHVALVLGKDR